MFKTEVLSAVLFKIKLENKSVRDEEGEERRISAMTTITDAAHKWFPCNKLFFFYKRLFQAQISTLSMEVTVRETGVEPPFLC